MMAELNKVREQIKSSLGDDSTVEVSALLNRLRLVEDENKKLIALVEKLESRLAKLEGSGSAPAAKSAPAPAKTAPSAAPKKDDDDDIDLFGDDDEDSEEQQRVREERLKAYADKKAKSEFVFPLSLFVHEAVNVILNKEPTIVAKSSVLLDVKVNIGFEEFKVGYVLICLKPAVGRRN